jgi:hypothetical protein
MEKLQVMRDVVSVVAILFLYVTAILVMALADVGIGYLIVRWSGTIKKASELPQPEAPLPKLPDDHKVVVIGGGLKRWE